MSTLLKALLVAGIGMTLNAAGANVALAQSNDTESNVRSPAESAANATGGQQDSGSSGPQRRNRDSTQQQGSMTPGPGAGTHSNDSGQTAGAPPVHSDEQSAHNPPANPSDPTDELRNRDSRKQQGEASRKLPEPTQKQN
jgi:hypothetical protein